MILAQLSSRSATSAEHGSDVAHWADSPEKLIAVWVVGGIVLVAIIVLFAKMKMDKG